MITVSQRQYTMAGGSDIRTENTVYFNNIKLLDYKQNVDDYDILQSVSKSIGENVKCLQLDIDLWRIYVKTKECRQKPLRKGLQFKNQAVSVYDFNPFSSGATNLSDPVLKVTLSGVPLSVQDKEIVSMLLNFNV